MSGKWSQKLWHRHCLSPFKVILKIAGRILTNNKDIIVNFKKLSKCWLTVVNKGDSRHPFCMHHHIMQSFYWWADQNIHIMVRRSMDHFLGMFWEDDIIIFYVHSYHAHHTIKVLQNSIRVVIHIVIQRFENLCDKYYLTRILHILFSFFNIGILQKLYVDVLSKPMLHILKYPVLSATNQSVKYLVKKCANFIIYFFPQ